MSCLETQSLKTRVKSEYAAVVLDCLHEAYNLANNIRKKNAEKAKKKYFSLRVNVKKCQEADQV